MLRNLPLSIFKDVDIGVTRLDLGAIFAHSEFVNSGILSPVASNEDVPRDNLA